MDIGFIGLVIWAAQEGRPLRQPYTFSANVFPLTGCPRSLSAANACRQVRTFHRDAIDDHQFRSEVPHRRDPREGLPGYLPTGTASLPLGPLGMATGFIHDAAEPPANLWDATK
jgi:hypothetical protein